MRTLLICTLLSLSVIGYSQTSIKRDSVSGNWIELQDSVKVKTGLKTAFVLEQKDGSKIPVLATDKGKYFVVLRNKEGKLYRRYLKS